MSPIRSSAAAGSSHALGDNRFAKTVTEVTAQRLEGRKTALSGAVATTATLNQTPVAGNHLVVFLSTNNSLVTPACSYGGTAGTQITGNFISGICAYAFYIPLTSSNIASGGTTLNITCASGPTIIGYSVTEISGVYAANPMDQSRTGTGSYNSSTGPTFGTGLHTTIGALGFAVCSVNGAQTFGFQSNGTDMTSGTAWGNFTNACDFYALPYSGGQRYTDNGALSWALGSATARNGVAIWVSFRPAA